MVNRDAQYLAGKRILLMTPFHRSQRGNSLTSERIQAGLKQMGIEIDLLSLEDENWENLFQQALDEQKYSLVHGFHGLHFAKVLRKTPKLHHLPLVLTMTGTDINFDLAGTNKELILNGMRAVQKIVVFNKQFAHHISSTYSEFHNQLLVIPQGVKLEDAPAISRQDIGLHDSDFVFLLPSGLREVKNIGLALDTLEALWPKYQNLRLLIMGAAIEEGYTKSILHRIKFLPWASYVGEIPHSMVKAYYQLADVVLNTSLAEGQPQAALEAMTLGIPAILTAVPGNLGIIEHGVQGYYAANQQELLEAARKLMQNPDVKKALGRAAHRLLNCNFLTETEFNSHAALYRSLLTNYLGMKA